MKTSHTTQLEFIQKAASIGTWEYNIVEELLYWSDYTKIIHEVPLDFEPDVKTGISFYKEGYSRQTITDKFTSCIERHQHYDVELQIVTAKGKDKWVRAIGYPVIVNGKCVKVQGLFQDIDTKTIIEKKLAYKEDQLRKTFENAVIGMAIVDLDGKWIDVNKSICKIFGYSKNEFKNFTFLDLTHPDDKSIGQKGIFDMLNGNTDHFKTEKRYIRKDGKTIWTLLSVSIVRDDTGKPMHFVAQINDFTELKQRSKKISDLIVTTEKQNKRLLNYAHIVSHNLRSHSSNLNMLISIAKIDVPEITENKIFPLIEKAVNQLGVTVENLNEVASINTKSDLKLHPINLNDALENVFSSIKAQIINANAEINNNIDKTLQVLGNTAYINSIFLNFLTNALKYKKVNEPPKIELTTQVDKEFIIFSIKDNGLGIDLKKHGNKLFGMYKTFHKHEDSRGLGLFITKNQIDAIGGKVDVESKVGVGTTFKIYFRKHE